MFPIERFFGISAVFLGFVFILVWFAHLGLMVYAAGRRHAVVSVASFAIMLLGLLGAYLCGAVLMPGAAMALSAAAVLVAAIWWAAASRTGAVEREGDRPATSDDPPPTSQNRRNA